MRFVLGVSGFIIVAQWGALASAELATAAARYALTYGLPLLLLVLWFVIGAPGDPLATRPPLVPVAGRVRMSLEIILLLFVLWCLFTSQRMLFAVVFAFAAALHVLWSLERFRWLVRGA